MELANSKTKENLMRAFAGECQARERYNIARQAARQQHYAVSELFRFTADQEKEHAEVFYGHLKEFTGQQVNISADYPVDTETDVCVLLERAVSHEQNESGELYPAFAKTAREEGFADIARDFENITKIEDTHSKRFDTFAKLMKEGRLYTSDKTETWVCLNCGFIVESDSAPEQCPVCGVPQGYYIRLSMAQWGNNGGRC
ncbi:rubrerythrin [Ruminococcus sp.]|uniref:rubrerythrin n=1 Tax=Ruminococcus sp. TaxID=41978 RepID=UPI0025F6C776|nr:rubrerythrin family protein [Ruminococcus sp.]MBQ8966336.1 rubrerythrin family protein [Ruminococcus sp.]